MMKNIMAHPKTSLAGLLIAATTIVGVLSAQGITLGHAGSGTVVSLVGALATAILGLVSRDPGSGTGASNNPGSQSSLGLLALALLLPATILLSGCPKMSGSQQLQAAHAVENASIVVSGFQDAEIAAHEQGLIPDDDHAFIQQQVLTLASIGKAADACIQGASATAGIVACVNAAIAGVDQVDKNGGLYLKSAKAKNDFALAMMGVKTALGVITTMLTPPPATGVALKPVDLPALYSNPRLRTLLYQQRRRYMWTLNAV